MLAGYHMDYSRLTTLLLISPLVRSKARSSFEKCSANLIQLQATLASPAYLHDGLYQPYPINDYGRANIGYQPYPLTDYGRASVGSGI